MGNILPWGCKAAAHHAVQENEKGRNARFEQAKLLCADLDEAMRKEILDLNFFELKDALQSDKYNAKMVLKAYMWKALEVHERINCINECLVEAFDKADALDVKYGGKPNKPPLFGLPFSVKGNFFVKDYECCIGLTKCLDGPKKDDCTLVTLLQDLGAVPFVTTNVPQALLSFVCSNSVYGTTEHPFKAGRIPGGSSGGEAALLASFGSSFGTGSDLAGSLRIPASMCGVIALKPTEARIHLRHSYGGIPGRGRMGLGIGFFSHDVDTQIFLLNHAWNSEYFHKTAPKSVPIPFRMNMVEDTLKVKSLRIGYFAEDGFLKATPGCERVVYETVTKLEAMGHHLIRFDLPRAFEAAEMCYKLIMLDGGTYLSKLYHKELVDEHLQTFVNLLNVPVIVRYIASFALGQLSPQAKVLARAYCNNIEELRLVQERVDLYTEEAIFDLWNEQDLDAVICPGFPIPAVAHKYPSLLGACGFSTAVWNMLDFPAGTVPVDHWNEDDERNLHDEKYWPVGNNFILKMMRDASTDSKGLPLGVQVIAKPYEEEKCLAVMKVVENAWKI